MELSALELSLEELSLFELSLLELSFSELSLFELPVAELLDPAFLEDSPDAVWPEVLEDSVLLFPEDSVASELLAVLELSEVSVLEFSEVSVLESLLSSVFSEDSSVEELS